MKRLISSIVALVIVASLVAVPAALAQGEGVTGVTGTLPAATIEVTAPTNITLGSLYGASGTVDMSATNGSVKCSGGVSAGYTLKINSDDAAGKMFINVTTKLDAALLVTSRIWKGDGADVTNTTYPNNEFVNTTGANIGSTTAPSDGTNDITLDVSQAKQATGVAGNYSLNLTFTATANT